MADPVIQEPQVVTETGAPVSDRLATPEACYFHYTQLREQTRWLAQLDARVMAVKNGNPPYSDSEFIELGQGWRANFNSRELKAAINSKAEAAYELHMETSTRVEFRVHPLYYPKTETPEEDWGAVIAEEYTELHKRWKDGYFQIDLATREMLSYGLGIMLWPDEWDWRPKAFRKSQFFIDPSSKVLPNELDTFGIRAEMRALDLLKAIEDPEAARKEGWNVVAVKELLVRVFIKGEVAQQAQGAVDLWWWCEQRIKNRDPEFQMRAFEMIPVVNLAVQEVDQEGGVTHILIAENSGGQMRWLRKVHRRFEKMSHLIWMIPYGYEDGYIGSLRGLGHELLVYAELSNRTLCAALDGGMIASGLLLQAQSGFDADQLAIIRNGPVTIVPPGLSAQQSTFTPPIEPMIALRSMFRDIATNNVGVFPMRPEQSLQTRQPEKTARQVVSEESKEARYEKNRANAEYMHWQNWHEEIWRRLTRPEYIFSERPLPGQAEAKELIRRCVMRGVPMEILFTPGALQLNISRVIGLGSPSARMDITNQVLGVARQSADETGRRWAEREWASARIGYCNVDKLFPLRNRDKIPSNEMSIATLENNDFLEGRPVPAGSDQVHTIHLDGAHFPLLQGMIQTVQDNPEGADLLQIYKTLRVAIPHAYQHIQFLATDPSREEYVARAQQVLGALVLFFKKIEGQIAKTEAERQKLRQDAAAGQLEEIRNQLSQEYQVKLREIEIKGELERMKQLSLNQMRADKTSTQMEINKWRAQQEAALNQWKAEQSARIDAFLAEQKARVDAVTKATAPSGAS